MSKDAFITSLSKEMDRITKNTDTWTERMNAVNQIHKHFESLEPSAASAVGADVWKVLKPLKAMVQDLRSQIVKEVCALFTTIASATRDAMVPYVREILPALLEVRGSGNKVCGTYCAECVDALVGFTVVKGPTLKQFVDIQLDTKNKLIRLSCITALKLTVVNWSAVLDKADVQQLERGLHNALNDPSSSCRSMSYEAFAAFQQKFSKRAAVLMGVVDYKIQKRLEAMVNGDTSMTSSRFTGADLPPMSAASPMKRGPATILESGSVDDDAKSSTTHTYDIGDRVCIPDKELFGFVRFIGEIEGVKSTWVGIELDQPMGKNDGSVKGRYYFRCKPKHGVFARPHQVFLTITSSEFQDQEAKQPIDTINVSSLTLDESFNGDDAVEAALNLELSSLQLTPGTTGETESAIGSVDVPEPSALQTVMTKASIAHRKYLVRMLQVVRAELEEHEQFDTYMSTASSADAVQYLQQLQNSAQDKIVLSDMFIQHVIQAQQAARES